MFMKGKCSCFKKSLIYFLKLLRNCKLLSNQKDEIETENDNFVTSETEFNNREVVKEDENNFETSGIISQNKKIRSKKIVAVSGHDQAEVRRKIKEILIKDDDYFKCTVCGRMSKDSSNMRKHVETHIEGLSFECDFCNNIFR